MFLCSASSHAYTFMYGDGDQLTGVDGIEALGEVWNVTFHGGSFSDVDNLFNLSQPFAFSDIESQTLSAELITAMSQLEGVMSQPSDIRGCDDQFGCEIFTPYAFYDISQVEGYAVGVLWNDIDQTIAVGAYPGLRRIDINTDQALSTFAIWEIAPVPVPAAVWLFGSGLIGLAGLARCRKT